MRSLSSKRWVLGGALLAVALSSCNELLGNDPRTWDPEGGGSGRGAGEAGKHYAGGEGGAAPPPIAGGTSGKGGTAGGKAGTSGKGGASGAQGGDGGFAADAGEGGNPNAGTPGVMCECEPGGAPLEQLEPCGDCLTGMRRQTRTCTPACTWGPWSGFGECMGVTATCTPGTPQSQSVACPCGGTKTQARSCSSACAWDAWIDTSGCDLECCTEIVYCNTPDNISPASRGTWCRETAAACSNEEVNADCYADADLVCDGVVPDLYIQYL
jgi:hypothetical protein